MLHYIDLFKKIHFTHINILSSRCLRILQFKTEDSPYIHLKLNLMISENCDFESDDESGDDEKVKSDDTRQENTVTGLNRLLLWLLV